MFEFYRCDKFLVRPMTPSIAIQGDFAVTDLEAQGKSSDWYCLAVLDIASQVANGF